MAFYRTAAQLQADAAVVCISAGVAPSAWDFTTTINSLKSNMKPRLTAQHCDEREKCIYMTKNCWKK